MELMFNCQHQDIIVSLSELNTGMEYWNGILEWNPGIKVLHVLREQTMLTHEAHNIQIKQPWKILGQDVQQSFSRSKSASEIYNYQQ